MAFLSTEHEKKAAVETSIIMLLLILSFFYIGILTYMDPPIEKGIEIVMENGAEVNYGTSDTGSGAIQPMTTDTPQSQNATNTQTQSGEPTLTQDTDDAPVVNTQPKVKPKKTNPKPDQSTNDALNNILGAPSNTNQNSNSHGNTGGGGDQGNISGDPYATAFYGGGTGSGTGYGMNGRSKTSNQKYTQECNEEGRVVVKIEVDRNGKVINAVPGVQGTTNTAPCLLDPAKRTALSYKFNADSKAPSKQIGFVVVNFTLGQ